MENWRTSPCFLSFPRSPCSLRAPNLLHVLPSRMVGWDDLCTPGKMFGFPNVFQVSLSHPIFHMAPFENEDLSVCQATTLCRPQQCQGFAKSFLHYFRVALLVEQRFDNHPNLFKCLPPKVDSLCLILFWLPLHRGILSLTKLQDGCQIKILISGELTKHCVF